MKQSLKNKIEIMLKIYRQRLIEKAHSADPYHTDYAEGIRILAAIEVLENLFYYANNEAQE